MRQRGEKGLINDAGEQLRVISFDCVITHLENTIKWLLNDEKISKPAIVFNPGDLDRIGRNLIEKEFTETLTTLRSL